MSISAGDPPVAFARYRDEIEAELRHILGPRESPLYDMLRYHLGWINESGEQISVTRGKSLRPVLCLLACSAETGDYTRALPAAAALELVHNFSLIHDDIQDNDAERHGRPTVWSIWGKSQAINAGTSMRILASLALDSLAHKGVTLDRQFRAHRLLDECSLSLIEGQYLDIDFESRFDITTSDYFTMISKKTACLITCALEMGAMLGTDDESHLEAFHQLGLALGLAFQVQDDILGIWGCSEDTGKPVYSDIRSHKKSLPIVYALERINAWQRNQFTQIYHDGMANTQEGIDTILGILDEIGARKAAEEMVEAYRIQALAVLDKIAIREEPRREMEDVTNFLARRNF
jgi:geranylgeranyl diphosphate synthase type I